MQPSCLEFVDPYVEHDSLTILLDLILLKRGVYRHLLFNRGAEPRMLSGKCEEQTIGASTPLSKNRVSFVPYVVTSWLQT